MTDRFDEVLGAGRGSGRDPDDDSPLAVARRMLGYINSRDAPWERTTPKAIMEELIPEHGLALHKELSSVHGYDHDGFLLLLSVTADGAATTCDLVAASGRGRRSTESLSERRLDDVPRDVPNGLREM
jgi:hypothetical protein